MAVTSSMMTHERFSEAAFMQGFIGEFADPRFEVHGQGYYASSIDEYYDTDELLKGDELSYFRQLQEAVEFGSAYPHEDERLAAIMQNVIDNGGTFVPSLYRFTQRMS